MEKKNIAAVQCQLENKVLCGARSVGPGPTEGKDSDVVPISGLSYAFVFPAGATQKIK